MLRVKIGDERTWMIPFGLLSILIGLGLGLRLVKNHPEVQKAVTGSLTGHSSLSWCVEWISATPEDLNPNLTHSLKRQNLPRIEWCVSIFAKADSRRYATATNKSGSSLYVS